MTLTCHRCLQNYNHRLTVGTSEIIWLDPAADLPDEGPMERELAVEDLVETLSPQGYFDPSEWLYQQLCLAMPQRQLCDASCVGVQPVTRESSEKLADRRWASLEALKNNYLTRAPNHYMSFREEFAPAATRSLSVNLHSNQ